MQWVTVECDSLQRVTVQRVTVSATGRSATGDYLYSLNEERRHIASLSSTGNTFAQYRDLCVIYAGWPEQKTTKTTRHTK